MSKMVVTGRFKSTAAKVDSPLKRSELQIAKLQTIKLSLIVVLFVSMNR